MPTPEFTHRHNFTAYQKVVLSWMRAAPRGHVLDIPAGAGQMAAALREIGHEVVYADMTTRLPFEDGAFDSVLCLEGIEHVLNPHDLIGELFRVCRVGGRVIISTPNVSSMYSRLQFLFTGTAHQFHFTQLRDLEPGVMDDRSTSRRSASAASRTSPPTGVAT